MFGDLLIQNYELCWGKKGKGAKLSQYNIPAPTGILGVDGNSVIACFNQDESKLFPEKGDEGYAMRFTTSSTLPLLTSFEWVYALDSIGNYASNDFRIEPISTQN